MSNGERARRLRRHTAMKVHVDVRGLLASHPTVVEEEVRPYRSKCRGEHVVDSLGCTQERRELDA